VVGDGLLVAASGPRRISVSRPLVLIGALALRIQDLLELLGQPGAHAGASGSVGVAISPPVSRCFSRRKFVVMSVHRPAVHSLLLPTCYDPASMELYGVRIPTIITDNIAARCAGCGDVIEGRPWRVSILDPVAPETPVSWTESPSINPGPFEFHGDPAHVLAWMAGRGMLFCRRSQVREIMRPVWLPTEPRVLGLCDGIHRDDHEFVDPAVYAADRS
jgi:hypothetical protein